MTAFAAALGALFFDPHLSLPALYRAGGAGPETPVRVMRRAPDEIVPWRDARAVVDTVFFDMRISDAPQLAAGDRIEVGGAVFEVLGAPERDAERTIWQFGARET